MAMLALPVITTVINAARNLNMKPVRLFLSLQGNLMQRTVNEWTNICIYN